MSVIVRYSAEPQAVVNENGRRTEPFTDHGDLTVKLTADTLRLQMNHVRTKKGFWYRGKELRNRWSEKLLTKMHFHRGLGYLPKLVTKSVRCSRRLRVPSLNKIAQMAVRPSPLWEFRAAICFRDLIAKLQNENPRRTAVV